MFNGCWRCIFTLVSRNLISGTLCPLPKQWPPKMSSFHPEKKWIRMLFLLTGCLFNGNRLRILEHTEILCKFYSLRRGPISKMSQLNLKPLRSFGCCLQMNRNHHWAVKRKATNDNLKRVSIYTTVCGK